MKGAGRDEMQPCSIISHLAAKCSVESNIVVCCQYVTILPIIINVRQLRSLLFSILRSLSVYLVVFLIYLPRATGEAGMNREEAPGKSPEDMYIQQKVRVLLMLKKMGSNVSMMSALF